jgi:hypothetical protein
MLPQYKSPTSWLVRLVCDSLALPFRPSKQSEGNPKGVGERFRFWLQRRSAPWRDYQWKAYNESYVDLLHSFNGDYFARFKGLGLSVALDILISERDTLDITCRFIQGIRQVVGSGNMLRIFDVPGDDYRKSVEQCKHNSGPEFIKFSDNFIDFLIVTSFASRSPKFCRISTLRRVEMYIQLKESMFSIFNDLATAFSAFGRHDVTPRVGPWDVESWGIGGIALIFLCGHTDLEVSIEIKFRFLKYMNYILDTQLMIPDSDFNTAYYIIDVDEARCLYYDHQSSGNPLLMAPIDWNHLVRVAIISMWRMESGTIARFLSKSYADW